MFFGLDVQVRQTRLPTQLRIGDVPSYSNYVSRLFQPCAIHIPAQIEKPTVFNTVALGPLRLIYTENTFDVTIRSPAFDQLFLLHVPLRGAFHVGDGKHSERVDTSNLLLVKPGRQISLALGAGCAFLVVQVHMDLIAPHISGPGWGRAFDPLGFGHLITPRRPEMEPLFSTLAYLYFEGGRFHDAQDMADLGTAMGSLLAQRIARCFTGEPANQDGLMEDPVFARAKELIRERLAQGPLEVRDVATCLQISTRSLQRLFARRTGLSPQQWIVGERLDLAHQLIMQPGQSGSVTDVAMAAGFQDLGRFAMQYRSRFGENPSAALRRARLG